VTTIIGRFLEHARFYYFHNGGEKEVLVGSADLMPRNLDRRVEILYPIRDPAIISAFANLILPQQLNDNEKLRLMKPDGTYERIIGDQTVPSLNAQEWFVSHQGAWYRANR
jgi:polyphosphate kinase